MIDIHEPIQKISEDVLERSGLAKVILHRFEDKECPSVLGIYGGWGSGKSSLISLLNKLNERKKSSKLHIEMFDAWKYETTGNLIIPIVTKLYKSAKSEMKIYADRVIKVTALFAADTLLKKFAGINLSNVDDYRKNINEATNLKRWESTLDEIDDINQAFKELINLYLEKNNFDRLVICIDNLDRCTPENAINLLESIKNLLTVPNCIWVFVVDNNVIASYIDQKYQGTKLDGHSYLDKIITEQYHIPSLRGKETKNLLKRIGIEFEPGAELSQLGNLLTPRRVIKAAIKFKQFYSRVEVPNSKSLSEAQLERKIVFSLIFLYCAWPEFYEFLSSDTPEYIEGVLRNYLPLNIKLENEIKKTPLPSKFLKEELIYFIQTAILNSGVNWKEYVLVEMIRLREVGLP